MPNSSIATLWGRLLLFVAVMVATVGIYGLYQSARFHRRLEALKAAGEMVDIDSLARHVEDEDDDAATYLLRIKDDLHKISQAIPRDDDVNIKTDADSLEIFDETMKDFPTFLENASLAANAPDFSFDFENNVQLPIGVIEIQAAGLVLDWEGRVLLARGNANGAVENAIELLKFADKLEGRSILNSLLANGFRILAWSLVCDCGADNRLDENLLQQVFELTDDLDLAELYREALKIERSISTYYMINTHLINDEGGFQPSGIEWLARQIPSGSVITVGNAYLDQTEIDIQRSTIPFSEDLPLRDDNFSILTVFGGDSGRAMDSLRLAIGDKIAAQRALRVAMTLQQSDEAKKRDTWPKEFLIGLGIPEEITVDPFTGETLKIQKSDGKWTVCSCGRDRVDSQGTQDDIGYLPNIPKSE